MVRKILTRLVVVFLCVVSLFIPSFAANDVPYYEKADVRARMEEKREIVSVVKIVPHPTQKKTKVLDMTAVGIVEGVAIPQAMKLMSDYENLQRIAPEYIKLSEVIKIKEKDKIQKYLHMRIEVSALLISYKLEIYARMKEETYPDKGIIHWEVVPASALGRKEISEKRFIGLKGSVAIENYKRPKAIAAQPPPIRGGRGFYRTRGGFRQALRVLFKGKMDRKEKQMDDVIPNIMVQFAMEVGLQRVGVLLRNYMETAKEESESP